MGYLDEITSMVKTIASTSAYDVANRVGDNKSITRRAMDGTLQFPCLVTDSLNIVTAATIARTLERVYASFVQTVLSLNSTIDISVDQNPVKFLRKFHQNVRTFESFEISDEEFLESYIPRISDGSMKVFVDTENKHVVLFNTADSATKAMLESNRVYLEKSLSYIDVTPLPQVSNSVFYEANKNDGTPSREEVMDALVASKRRDYTKRDSEIFRNSQVSNPVPQMLTSKEVSKSNDLQPYAMQVRLLAVNDKKEFVQFMDFVVGIKVILHEMRSEEVVVNTTRAIENNGKFFNFLKFTTGEKSFFKDLLFNLNNVKLDVANKSRGASPWWLTLKRRRDTSKMQQSLLMRNQMLPNATLVLSSYEVDVIRDNHGYDLTNISIAKKLIDGLFLMCFVIVDEGTEIIRVLYDGENNFQLYSLATLEKEIQASSNRNLRELVRQIGNK